jgi:hypothetical protein
MIEDGRKQAICQLGGDLARNKTRHKAQGLEYFWQNFIATN